MTSKQLYIKTFGCQMNIYDSDRMIDIMQMLGYAVVTEPDNADMIILNTCHIREKATEKVYSDLGRLRKIKHQRELGGKQTLIAVAGCTAQAEGQEIMNRATYVDLVFGPQSYHKLPEMLAELKRKADAGHQGAGRGIVDIEFPLESKFDLLPAMTNHHGATGLIAIQEGCDKFCHFCVVPYTRGAEYSRPVADIIAEAQRLIQQGVREITLVGQNVNAYHGAAPINKQEWGLGRLCAELAEINQLERIRYMTSHPNDVDDDLIQAHKNIDKLMPFLHLPIQSGSDTMLKAMNRRHTVDDYRRVIDRFRHARADMAFSSDFIVGYPGETAQDYLATLKLIDEIKYAQSYSFKYSKRPGTPAALMENQVPPNVQDERLAGLQELLRTHQCAFNTSMIGHIMPVLFDRDGRQDNQLVGRSPYLQCVKVQASKRLKGHIVMVNIIDAFQNGLRGTICINEYENLTKN